MIPFSSLPTLNAIFNFTSAVLLVIGFAMIKRKKVTPHRIFMGSAFVTSILFLTSYIIYHAHAGATRFTGQGFIRPIYFTILISHTILAALVPILAVITLTFALRQKFDRHRKIARWTLPIWLYVSVTGVVIYLMLYLH